MRLCEWEDVEAEVDEMWSFVQSKQQQRWLWHAIDHCTGEVLAYVLSNHQDSAFLELKALLEPFGITQFYTDVWGACVGVVCRMHHAILSMLGIPLAKPILKPLNVNISPDALGLSDWLKKRFASPSPFGCMMLSLVYSSTAMNLA